MKRQIEQVRQFNEALDVSINEKFDYLELKDAEVMRTLILEELREWEIAQKTKAGKHEVLDGLVDMMYLVLGTAVRHGISSKLLIEAFDEVHKTNMAKQGGKKRADGKVLKPEGWQPPNLKGIISLHESFVYVMPNGLKGKYAMKHISELLNKEVAKFEVMDSAPTLVMPKIRMGDNEVSLVVDVKTEGGYAKLECNNLEMIFEDVLEVHNWDIEKPFFKFRKGSLIQISSYVQECLSSQSMHKINF